MRNPFSKPDSHCPTTRPEPTPEAKALLAEAAQAYAAHNQKDMFAKADDTTSRTAGPPTAQRGAARRWSRPPQSRDGGE